MVGKQLVLRTQGVDGVDQIDQIFRVVQVGHGAVFTFQALRQDGCAHAVFAFAKVNQNQCGVSFKRIKLRRQGAAHIGQGGKSTDD